VRLNRHRAAAVVLLLGITAVAAPAQTLTPAKSGQNVVLIVTDGLRWQELFDGADPALNNEEFGGVEDTSALRRRFLVGDATANRRALMPFMWEVIARDGQIYGNRRLGSSAVVTNGLKFSYPGYNEMLTGRPDPRIDRNDYGPNPNVTVFEWLALQPGFMGRVAAFGTWDVFAQIFNRARAKMTVHAGWGLPFPGSTDPPRILLDSLYATTTRLWDIMPYDAFLQAVVIEYLRTERPRVLYLGFGETDEWAHSRRYDQYLATAHHVDGFIRDLWQAMQALPEYAGRTTFIITTDHGRGGSLKDWTDHGKDVEGAEYIWIAVMGPGIAGLGERHDVPLVTQAQVAATVAMAVTMDWVKASRPAPTAGPLPVFAP
jgi:hypothetical protein